MSPAVTDWIAPAQKPWEPGLYERWWDSGGTRWTWWNGKHWCVSSSTQELACQYSDMPSGRQHQPWRGLAADPNKKAAQLVAGIDFSPEGADVQITAQTYAGRWGPSA